jgi:prevent-host-death family protein
MPKTITLRNANQSFARYVREVEAGAEFIITRNGEPVARLAPLTSRRALRPDQLAARARARARMEQGWPIAAGKLNRDELHEH